MTRTLSMAEAQEWLTQLPKAQAGSGQETIAVTSDGKPVLAVIPWDVYESLLETLEILGDPDQMAALERGIQDAASGRTHDLDAVLADLGW